MSEYRELIEEFFTRYEYPVIEPFIMGFSGIDPPLKQTPPVSDHERLLHLLGGEPNGHYHLTREQLDWLIEQMTEKYPPEITGNQVISGKSDTRIQDYEVQGTNVR